MMLPPDQPRTVAEPATHRTATASKPDPSREAAGGFPASATRGRVLGAGIAAAALVILAWAVAPRFVREMPDFEVYWTAAVRARAAEPLYRVEDEHYLLKYLPAFAVFAMPLSAVALTPAKTLWFIGSVAMIALLIAISLRLLPERRKPAWVLAIATIVVMGKFYGHELVLGQVNLLMGTLGAGGLLALRRGRDGVAGVLFALAIIVKPYAVIFLPWLAAGDRRRATVTASAGLLAALALPLPIYGLAGTVDLHRSWWLTVTTSTAPNLLNQDNVSLAAMYAKWLAPGSLAARLAVATGAALLGLAALAFLRRRDVRSPGGLEGALLLTLIPLLSPQGWDYVFLIATPAVVYVVNYEDRLPPRIRVPALAALAVIGLSLYDVMGRANYARFMALSVITVCFTIVFAALVTIRLRRIA